ncbi:transporter [Ganoderma sinense ZZ0214-1]|uniref:Transporter n=1 Tax=Ganoderma sinense ZZ0214-1 TaxID=1077348 RepID=A0A2G8RSG4_9APHY|nr:transporter [Ganoderma sinense ZZ0214-1]
MPTLICRICLDALHEKKMVSTKCGHIFCAECAGVVFARARVRVPCPVCRKPNTYSQLIRLFPEWELTDDPPTPKPKPASTLSLSDAKFDSSTSTTASATITTTSVPPAYYYAAPTSVELYVPLGAHPAFPWDAAGDVPAWDVDGTPVYLGITLFNDGWHPCKVKPYAACPARVSYGGKEVAHWGMCHLLPFSPATMEWVPTSRGRIPHGRRPVEGGYEEIGGDMLYHALACVDGVRVPGKAGLHLAHGASIPYGNQEYIVSHYDILCWRDF